MHEVWQNSPAGSCPEEGSGLGFVLGKSAFGVSHAVPVYFENSTVCHSSLVNPNLLNITAVDNCVQRGSQKGGEAFYLGKQIGSSGIHHNMSAIYQSYV